MMEVIIPLAGILAVTALSMAVRTTRVENC
jgi:hypothetical protein